jgi:hypothetical protein
MLRRDSIGLSDAQMAQLQVIADSLDKLLKPVVDTLRNAIQAQAAADSVQRAAAVADSTARAAGDTARSAAGDSTRRAQSGQNTQGRGGQGNAQRGGPGQRGNNPAFQVMQRMQPVLEQGRRMMTDAMAEARKVLTSDQWNKLPPNIRNFGQQQGPGGRRGGGGGID